MPDCNSDLTLQILNLVVSFLSPLVIALAYLLRRITKSRCCKNFVEIDIQKSPIDEPGGDGKDEENNSRSKDRIILFNSKFKTKDERE